jgi:uncharacterized protein (TIGR03118 family)
MMKSLLSLAVGTTLTALSLGAVSYAQQYNQTNLVSNTSGLARVTDSLAKDSWGIARASDLDWWVNQNDTGVSTLYNGAGTKNSLVVTIPPVNPQKNPKGSPTGIIANNSTTDFLLAANTPAEFIFDTLDGAIAGWNPNFAISQGGAAPSTNAVLVVKNTDGSSYTGMTANFINGKRFLYLANFGKNRIDVYDNSFHRVNLESNSENPYQFDEFRVPRLNKPFVDDQLPPNFAPFNVQAIGPDIVVTYGLKVEGQETAEGGEGLGYVDIYSSDGRLLTRLEHVPQLNAPWGVTLAPLDFGFYSHQLLIGQFGGGGSTPYAGTIAAYDLATGKFEGLLEDTTGKPITISGLWDLGPGNISPDNLDAGAAPAAEVYFSARNSGEALFGYFTAITSQLIEGSAQ